MAVKRAGGVGGGSEKKTFSLANIQCDVSFHFSCMHIIAFSIEQQLRWWCFVIRLPMCQWGAGCEYVMHMMLYSSYSDCSYCLYYVCLWTGNSCQSAIQCTWRTVSNSVTWFHHFFVYCVIRIDWVMMMMVVLVTFLEYWRIQHIKSFGDNALHNAQFTL